MVKCPECKEEIDHLTTDATATKEVALYDDGYYAGLDDLTENTETNEFRCPSCGVFICFHEDEALEFLRGEEHEK